jgi:hypothetical protein
VNRVALVILAACSGQPHRVQRTERIVASADMTLRERPSQLASGADAYAAVKAGLAELGQDHAPRGAIDDTNSLLRIAEIADDPAKAADAARKALVDRIAM